MTGCISRTVGDKDRSKGGVVVRTIAFRESALVQIPASTPYVG